jgi:Domain of unknown function (DUF4145)
MADLKWHAELNLGARKYLCGYCGLNVGPDKGTFTERSPDTKRFVYFCSNCGQPTYFDALGRQYPGARFGDDVAHLPQDVRQLYEEARSCMSSQAFTPAVLACRKILMNVTVALGANPGEPFVNYVQFLADNGYVPPKGKHWVDHIRKKSNEANHEITLMKKEDAEQLITFVEMMLKFIYELPAAVPVANP